MFSLNIQIELRRRQFIIHHPNQNDSNIKVTLMAPEWEFII